MITNIFNKLFRKSNTYTPSKGGLQYIDEASAQADSESTNVHNVDSVPDIKDIKLIETFCFTEKSANIMLESTPTLHGLYMWLYKGDSFPINFDLSTDMCIYQTTIASKMNRISPYTLVFNKANLISYKIEVGYQNKLLKDSSIVMQILGPELTPIYFYESTDILSNYYPCKIVMDGLRYPSAEHAYQASKFDDIAMKEIFCTVKLYPHQVAVIDDEFTIHNDTDKEVEMGITPEQATLLSTKYKHLKNPTFNKLKSMEKVLLAKFHQNDDLRQFLMDTKYHELIENSPTDNFWGCGSDGTGENHLGKLLQSIRFDML